MDISQLLAAALGPHRAQAEQQLTALENQNLVLYFTGLTAELVDETKPEATRTLAGIQIKNRLDSEKNEAKRLQYHQDWRNLDANSRENIKNGVLQTLGSPSSARNAAAQVVAKIAQIELPANMWPTLIDRLLANMSATGSTDNLKQATLNTLGYICEEIDPAVVNEKSDLILTAVVQGMRKEQTNSEVKLAAARALENALEFAKQNFERANERDVIMGVVCEAVLSPDTNVRIAAYQCLVTIASLYYSKLPPYMQSIFGLTLESIKKDPQPVAQQAVEFWSTICEEEVYLIDEIEEAIEMKVQPTQVCHNFIKGALKYLVPLILGTLTQQEEDADEDTWDLSMAGATCLTLIGNCVRNDIVEIVLPFVTDNINNQDWHHREAAVMAFGSILEGTVNINPLIQQALPVLVQHMKDPDARVKDATAWTLGRICQLHPVSIRGKDDTFLDHMVSTLLQALADAPRVATNACWALNNIAEAFRDDDNRPGTSYHRYFSFTVNELLKAADREDADENNLKVSAYEAVNSFFAASDTPECIEELNKIVPSIINRLLATFSNNKILTGADRDAQIETQGLLCGLLATAMQKLRDKVLPYADAMADLFIKVLNNKSSTVQEEALMAFGALADATEDKFVRYMPTFFPYLLLGLNSPEELSVCKIAVGVVGDVCRALGKGVAPYTDDIVKILITHLSNNQLHKSAKPDIFRCFGDIAIALCSAFGRQYMQVFMQVCEGAMGLKVDTKDDEMVEWLNGLREGILEAYTGILQGLHSDKQAELFLPYVQGVIQFTGIIYQDQTRTDSVMRAAIGVIGDIAQTLESKAKPFLKQDFVTNLLNEYTQAEDESLSEVAQWAQDLIRKQP